MQQDSKQVQVDLQDLGYETSGRSENEAERDGTSSPGGSDPGRPQTRWLSERAGTTLRVPLVCPRGFQSTSFSKICPAVGEIFC